MPNPRSVLSLREWSRAQIESLLDRAAAFKAKEPKPQASAGKIKIANLFFENSTRTRTSFELAESSLGLKVVSFSPPSSSLQKGESLRDTVQALQAMGVFAFVVRHAQSGAAAYVAKHASAVVLNAGDGQHEHPSQALIDALTLREHFLSQHLGKLEGRCVTIIGDIRHSRVARSNLQCLPKLGCKVRLFAPEPLLPRALIEGLVGVTVAENFAAAVEGVDAVMVLRLQSERMTQGFLPSLADYRRGWGLTVERAATLGPKTAVLHPGPMNRGVEIDDAVADGDRSLVLGQVRNGVAVRQALLDQALGLGTQLS